MTVGALVLAEEIVGTTEASATRSPTRKPTRSDRRTVAWNATRSSLTDGDSIG
jgi:hypothetical protein